MSQYKSVFFGILFIAAIAISGHIWRAHQFEQKRTSADRFLSAAIQENQNCLRKLSGWRDHLTDTDKNVHIELKNCRLKETSVEIKNIPQNACIGLAEKLFQSTTKTSILKNMTIAGHPVTADTCTNDNTVLFDFETTEAGLSWYEKMVQGSRRRDMYLSKEESGQEERPNLFVGTLIARLKRLDDESLYDFTVSLENGQVLIITQEDNLSLNNGDAVMVIHENGQTRIQKKISP